MIFFAAGFSKRQILTAFFTDLLRPRFLFTLLFTFCG